MKTLVFFCYFRGVGDYVWSSHKNLNNTFISLDYKNINNKKF